MAPVPITEDLYKILEVEQTATNKEIVQSYKRLALKLHPDRNSNYDTTAAFQRLVKAYETLKDESKRRAYDFIYPSISRGRSSPQTKHTPGPTPNSPPESGTLSEAAALQKSKQERNAQWQTRKNAFDSSVFELQREIRRLEQQIKFLDSILAATAAEEAQKNSWGAWLLSPIYKRVEDSEEEKSRKDRENQERKIEKDMKKRRLDIKKADLMKKESLLRKAKEDVDAADQADDRKIRVIKDRIWTRESRERQERERVEREIRAKILKQQREEQEKRAREAAEELRKRNAEMQAAQQKLQEELAASWRNKRAEQERERFVSSCRHDGWWPKVQGRVACPKCDEVWTYLLQCPGCKMNACPRCQASIRPRTTRAERLSRRAPSTTKIPSPVHSYYFDDDYY